MQTTDQKRSIQNRLNRLEGQLRGINRMVDENRECGEVCVATDDRSSFCVAEYDRSLP